MARQYYKDSTTGQMKPLGVKVEDTLPVGIIIPYSGSILPEGYMFCDGSAISRTFYAQLFEKIGTYFGNGDGSTTFNLPNLKGKIPVGLDSNDTDFDTLGKTNGNKNVTLTSDNLPSHNHKIGYKNSAGSGGTLPIYTALVNDYADGNTKYNTLITLQNGSQQPFNNMPPYTVLNYIIKVYQVIPTNAKLENGDSTSATNGYTAEYINNHSVVVSPTEPTGSARKKVWKKHNPNLFNLDNATLNCRLSSYGTNETATGSGYFTSEFIKVNPNTSYIKNSPIENAYHRIAYYSSNNESSFISLTENNVSTTPSTCNYIRICGLMTEMAYTIIQEGSTIIQDKEYILNDNDIYEEYNQELVLWENSSPTSDFAGQTINLKTDNYSYYEIIWRLVKNSNQYKNTGKTTKSTYAYLDYVGGAGTLLGFKRDITAVTDTSITFADAYRINTNEVENGRCIPVKVIGYK